MKILHLSSERSWRGGEQQLAYLLEELPALGIECVTACRKGSAFEQYCQRTGQTYESLPFANEFDLYSAFRIGQICRKHNIDVVHAHSGHSHALAVWSHVLGNKRPIVLHRRVDFPIKNNALSHYKYNYPGIVRIICVSDKVKEILARDLKQPEKCVTIYDGIDLQKFPEVAPGRLRAKYNIDAELPLVGNVAALSHQKDYHTFIDTVALLVQQGLEAVFFAIGQGDLEQELKQYAAHKGVADKIIFTGFRTDIPEILPELDVLLFTSRTEGLGSTLLDAFACGVPVVSTTAGGIPEIVTQGVTGLLAPVGDAPALAAHVQRVLKELDLAQALIKTANQQVKRFEKSNIAAEIARLYHSLNSEVQYSQSAIFDIK